ncbi:sugar-binding transcriptional regulator [Listeria grayi]|uniref:Sugar-binding domain protein n=2 Tax=Listeria grayi TaxID=1641 RepID=D7UWD8_LISGR|nr:sugar-binding transcriptional regulator [Listeria grayi]EFI84866.1 putative sugar-binding domain protein [Listeria grayi DSM 20601]STY44328.1 Central glycolytic genes regulator [Listeria grayi]
MSDIVNLQKKLIPDVLKVMQKRYQILRSIYFSEPVGRRTLASMLGMSERVLRSEVEFLKAQNLIDIASSGMKVTTEGLNVFRELESIMNQLSGLHSMEQALQEKLQIRKCLIVQGNSDETPWVQEEMGRTAIQQLDMALTEKKNVIAVMGGFTMATVAEMMTPDFAKGRELLFVPGRGGLGEDLDNQANTICDKLATKTRTKHRVLYVPEQLGEEAYRSLLKEPSIQEGLRLVQSANAIIHGIGDAMTMASRRHASPAVVDKITQRKAVGEAFGYYFNEQGEVVHKVSTFGLQFEELTKIPHIIAVAGGESKAKAIKSYMKTAPRNTILITDAGAAESLLKGQPLLK